MIPARFAYDRPASLNEAIRILAEEAGLARPLAGGQSLLPLMKLRLARPERLVDIGRFEELRGIRALADGTLAIGALTTWAELLADARVTAHASLADAIPGIGDVQVRNRGTIGGSLAHADPASDIAAVLLARSAELVVRSSEGERIVPMAELDAGPFVTTLQAGELITEVRLPPASSGLGAAYMSLPHPASGYPVAGVAAELARASGSKDRWATCVVGVTGVGEIPYRASEVERAVTDGATPREAAELVTEGRRVLSDPYADRAYRTAMARVMVERALALATRRAA